MKYAVKIAQLKCAGDRRGAYLALKPPLVGPACWDQDIKETMDFIVNKKWIGNTGFSMQSFLNQHHAS